ncbi:MAG: hypothetical protein A4S09_14290 [Proteobacteria bacterium SG_bin7]|nr:MAG: hypothetical protein A4S09_14290 [Proteobacteria bacterium SG_bin7]
MSAQKKQAKDSILFNICSVVTKVAGIQLGDKQRGMVESRLEKRIHNLGLKGLSEYYSHFCENQDIEAEHLISLLTTHHTYFFREFIHFEYLLKNLPEIVSRARSRGDNTIRVWSAACSYGQEAYSISMFFKHHLAVLAPEIKIKIVGTDVDPKSVSIAKNGVYLRNEIKSIPLNYLASNWARGSGEISNYVKAKKSIAESCSFSVHNLTEPLSQISNTPFDIIFCRNVFIYFALPTIKEVTERMLRLLDPRGFLFLGVSENLNGLGLPLKIIGPSVYSHSSFVENVVPIKPEIKNDTKPPSPLSSPSLLKVLCVDDSPTVHTLMKQILTKDLGFEIVGNAFNTSEAKQKIRDLKPDVITLDIHMPGQTGIEYLEKNFDQSHPPVVIMSSVSREERGLAFKGLSCGASDYVEKPKIADFTERGDEIRTKLKCAYASHSVRNKKDLVLEKTFSKETTIAHPENKLRIIVGNLSSREKIGYLLKELSGGQPPTYILVEGAEAVLQDMGSFWQKLSGRPIKYIEKVGESSKPNSNDIMVCDFKSGFKWLFDSFRKNRTSIIVFSDVSGHATLQICKWEDSHLLIEDIGKIHKNTKLIARANDVVPATSFGFLSSEYLGRES